ncbi:hypothetical protein [Fervidicoccus sp.]|uniref:hypothetical protein n=1 Tax=Fervidicoccus sp. TaxID=2060324 RepID=UPI003D0CBF33
MPTVHLSISDKLYDELREIAEEYGIQITDLIKVFIKNNLKAARRGTLSPDNEDTEKLEELEEKIEQISSQIIQLNKFTERQLKIQNSMIKALEEKVSNLELIIDELEEKMDNEKPYVEPEIMK